MEDALKTKSLHDFTTLLTSLRTRIRKLTYRF